MNRRLTASAAVLACVLAAAPALAQDQVLNLYSARHYQTDEALYQNFTKQTGIRINRIEAGDDAADRAPEERGREQPRRRAADRRRRAARAGRRARPVPAGEVEGARGAHSRGACATPQGAWFGLSSRARIIVYNKATMNPADVATYASLADPKNKGKVCTRSGSHPYNLSLMSAQIATPRRGEGRGVGEGRRRNLARKPQGGDTDQIKAVAAGECGVALSNSYYYARLLRSTSPKTARSRARGRGLAEPGRLGHAPQHLRRRRAQARPAHRDNAIRFLEYLASDEAQGYFADGNNEWPAVPRCRSTNPALATLGEFKDDPPNVATLGSNQPTAQKLYDRVAWK